MRYGPGGAFHMGAGSAQYAPMNGARAGAMGLGQMGGNGGGVVGGAGGASAVGLQPPRRDAGPEAARMQGLGMGPSALGMGPMPGSAPAPRGAMNGGAGGMPLGGPPRQGMMGSGIGMQGGRGGAPQMGMGMMQQHGSGMGADFGMPRAMMMPRMPGHLGDMGAAEVSLPAFDSNDFPALGGQPAMARNGMGGVQGMLMQQQDHMMMSGQEQHYSAMAMHKQSIVGLHSEFSIETEDFPALGGGGPGDQKPAGGAGAAAAAQPPQPPPPVAEHHMDQPPHPDQMHRRPMQMPAGAQAQMQMHGMGHPLNQPPAGGPPPPPRHPHQQAIDEKQDFLEQPRHMGQALPPYFAAQQQQQQQHQQRNGHQEQGAGAAGRGAAEDAIAQQQRHQIQRQPGNGDAAPPGGDAPGAPKPGEDEMAKEPAPGGSPPRGPGPDADGRGNDRFGLMGLLSVIQRKDADLTTLALGIDLTSMGLSVNSPENLYKTFGMPWSDAPSRTADHDFVLPACYMQPAARLLPGNFEKFTLETLFFVFYTKPHDESQMVAAAELNSRSWFYHRELKVWFSRVGDPDQPPIKSDRSETGSFFVFDPVSWERVRKDNFTVEYDKIERSAAPHPAQQQQTRQQQQQQQQQAGVPVGGQMRPPPSQGQAPGRPAADQPQQQ